MNRYTGPETLLAALGFIPDYGRNYYFLPGLEKGQILAVCVPGGEIDSTRPKDELQELFGEYMEEVKG